MATPFHVEVVTPERLLFSGDAEEVSLRTEEGEIAFLAHHEDFIAALDITVVRIVTTSAGGSEASPSGGGEHLGEVRLAVAGGFVHVEQDANVVTILAGVAELASEIDVDRARRALERAAQTRPSEATGVDVTDTSATTGRAMLAILDPESPEATAKRARIRLEAAGATPST